MTGVRSLELGNSGVLVSLCCLGTMTWGEQNSEADAHEQLDYYVKHVNNPFIDTAELYPVPPLAKTCGLTETYIGNWLEQNPEMRGKIFLATKVSGRSGRGWIVANRDDPPGPESSTRLTKDQILKACDGSLRRLKTTYVDLYQIHWPDRYTPLFGERAYVRSNENKESVDFEEIVGAVGELIKAGKIRHWGISNENAFGVVKYLEACKKLDVPPPISIQNDFSILHRMFEQDGTAEACAPMNVPGGSNGIGLLVYGALAGGTLSGKYSKNSAESAARHKKYPDFQPRYHSEGSLEASAAYAQLAQKHGLTATQLALAWAGSREYTGSVIIGATTMDQLKENIAAMAVTLTPECVADVDQLASKFDQPYYKNAARAGRQVAPGTLQKEL